MHEKGFFFCCFRRKIATFTWNTPKWIMLIYGKVKISFRLEYVRYIQMVDRLSGRKMNLRKLKLPGFHSIIILEL